MLYSMVVDGEVGWLIGSIIVVIYGLVWAAGLKIAATMLKVDLEPLALAIIVVLCSVVSLFPGGEIWSICLATFLLKRITDEEWGHAWWLVILSKALVFLLIIVSYIALEKWQERQEERAPPTEIEQLQRMAEEGRNALLGR